VVEPDVMEAFFFLLGERVLDRDFRVLMDERKVVRAVDYFMGI
jgi:hypothetical protein